MKTPTLFTCLLVIALLCCSIAEPMKSSISVDGKSPFKVHVIFPNNSTYLEVQALSRAMGWRLVTQQNAVLLNQKRLTNLKKYERKTYVNVDELAQAFGYKVESRSQGQVINLFSQSGASAGAGLSLSLTVAKREKGSTSDPKSKTLKLTANLTNKGGQIVQLNASQFILSDDKGNNYPCDGSFGIVLQPKERKKVEGLFFVLPRQASEKKLTLMGRDRKPVASARI